MKNIAIFAHVDAGKTTTTENLLYITGVTKKMGLVDSGTTVTDSLNIEKKRGITVKSAVISIKYKGQKINIIDTPGHNEFISEVKNSLEVIDGAVLIVSAVEGVQTQTKLIYNYLKENHIPVIIFINKIDRLGVSLITIKEQLKQLHNNAFFFDSSELLNEDIFERLTNFISGFSECFLKHYIEGKVTVNNILDYVLESIVRGQGLYVTSGSSKRQIGIKVLLEMIRFLLPEYKEKDGETSAYIFKIDYLDGKQVAYIRIMRGSLRQNKNYRYINHNIKFNKIFTSSEGKYIQVEEVKAGDIAIVPCAVDFMVGEFIGVKEKIRSIDIEIPIYRANVSLVDKQNLFAFNNCMKELMQEDSKLNVVKIEGKYYIDLYGTFHMEIIKELILERYNLQVDFAEIDPIYKIRAVNKLELVISRKVSPEFSGLGLRIISLGTSDPVSFHSLISIGDLKEGYQEGVREGVVEFCHEGLNSMEIVGCRIEMFYYDFDSVKSSPSEFKRLAKYLLSKIFCEQEFEILEPYISINIRISKEYSEFIMGHLFNFKVKIRNIEYNSQDIMIYGIMPLTLLYDLKLKVDAVTKGSAEISYSIAGYKATNNVYVNKESN